MANTTSDLDVADDHHLTTQARAGIEAAFEELYRRHGTSAWSLAWAVTDDAAAARATTIEAFARSYTALRAGRGDGVPFSDLIRNQVVNVAVDRASRSAETGADPAAHPGPDPDPVCETFRQLPLTWRATSWLVDGAGLHLEGVARVLGLDAGECAALHTRACAGWRERYLRSHLAMTGNRNCSRAVGRMRTAGDAALDDHAQQALDRHLRLCEPCSERATTVTHLPVALAGAVPAVPQLLVDDVRAAWSAAVRTTALRPGLTPRAEKVLAGATAVVAALGLVGAAILGTGSDDAEPSHTAAQATAPPRIVTDLSSPLPIDLAAAADLAGLPVATAAPSPAFGSGGEDGSVQPLTGADATGATLAPGDGNGDTDTPTDDGADDGADDDGVPSEGPGDTAPVPETGAPSVAAAATVGGVPVAVDADDDPGVTVGPISAGSEPQPAAEPSVTVGGPLEPAQPVVDAVVEAAPLG